jgi:hypothetical protein
MTGSAKNSAALALALGLLPVFVPVEMISERTSRNNQSAPDFHAVTTDGKSNAGQLHEMALDGRIRIGQPASNLPAARWLSLRRKDRPIPPYSSDRQVIFAHGDRIPVAEGSDVLLADNVLTIVPAAPIVMNAGSLHAPRSALAVIWFGPSPSGEDAELLLHRMATQAPATDVVTLTQGDQIEGSLTGLSAKQCKITVRGRETSVALETVRCIVFRASSRLSANPQGRFLHVVLENGARLSLTEGSVPQGKGLLQGQSAFGEALEIGLGTVAALDVRGGKATYLSDLEPTRYAHVAYAGPAWPLMRDSSAGGRPLRLGVSTFDKGLGTHAECRIEFALDPKYRWFEASVGLDPTDGKRGRVKLRVAVDGVERDLPIKELKGGDEPASLRVALRGGRALTLEVLYAGFGDVQAHVNWGDARLVE